MNKYLIHPATFKLDGGAMFGIIPKPLWSKKIKPDDMNRINMALRIIYIETENRKILIDTGIGDFYEEKFVQQFDIVGDKNPVIAVLSNNLEVNADDITDIIITHLHFDHVGGLGSEGNVLFRNARLHLHKNHLEYALAPTLRDTGSFHKKNFLPLINYYQENEQINLIEGQEGIILSDSNEKISFKTSFGHTPYMIHPIFDDYIYMADLVPMSHHIRLPWVMGYDIEPGTTTLFKELFYEFIIENKLKMIFEHDIDCWGGPLQINEKNQFELKEKYLSKKEPFEKIG